MLIDPISITYSENITKKLVSNPDQAKFIRELKGTLLSVGWTMVEELYATAFIHLLGGFGAHGAQVSFPKVDLEWEDPLMALRFGIAMYKFYDPANQIPQPPPEGGSWIALGDSSNQTLSNFVTAIGGGIFDTSYNSFLGGIEITAKLPGPDFNLLAISSEMSGIIGIVPATAGGGYLLEATQAVSVYQMKIIGELTFNPDAQMLATFTLNGTDAVPLRLWDLTAGVVEYTILASKHGFVLFAHPHNISGLSSLFVMAPQTEAAYAVLLLGPNAVGGPSFWTGQYGRSQMSLDGNPFVGAGQNPWGRVLSFFSPNEPLYTPFTDISLSPLILGTYVMFGESASESAPSFVVGKLWDCALVSEFIDTEINIDDKHFLTLGHNILANRAGQSVCSLVMYDGTAATGPDKDSYEFQQSGSGLSAAVAVGNVAY